jgi:hypothetical protein
MADRLHTQGPYTLGRWSESGVMVISGHGLVIGQLYGGEEWCKSVVALMNGEAVGALLGLLVEVVGTGVENAPKGILERLNVEYEGQQRIVDDFTTKVRDLFKRVRG